MNKSNSNPNPTVMQDMLAVLNAMKTELQGLSSKVGAGHTKPLYTNAEIKELLHIDDSTLRRYRNDGLLSYSKVRDKFFYSAQDVDDFLKNSHEDAYYYN